MAQPPIQVIQSIGRISSSHLPRWPQIKRDCARDGRSLAHQTGSAVLNALASSQFLGDKAPNLLQCSVSR